MGGWTGPGAAGSVLVPVGFLKEQRNYELEADRDAVRLMSAAGFDPRALLDYVARMQPPPSLRPSALPDRNVRIQNLEQAIQRVPHAESMPRDGFRAIQKQVATLIPAEASPAPLKPPTLKRPGEK
jgi:predicted Zn-dependent protease